MKIPQDGQADSLGQVGDSLCDLRASVQRNGDPHLMAVLLCLGVRLHERHGTVGTFHLEATWPVAELVDGAKVVHDAGHKEVARGPRLRNRIEKDADAVV